MPTDEEVVERAEQHGLTYKETRDLVLENRERENESEQSDSGSGTDTSSTTTNTTDSE